MKEWSKKTVRKIAAAGIIAGIILIAAMLVLFYLEWDSLAGMAAAFGVGIAGVFLLFWNIRLFPTTPEEEKGAADLVDSLYAIHNGDAAHIILKKKYTKPDGSTWIHCTYATGLTADFPAEDEKPAGGKAGGQ